MLTFTHYLRIIGIVSYDGTQTLHLFPCLGFFFQETYASLVALRTLHLLSLRHV